MGSNLSQVSYLREQRQHPWIGDSPLFGAELNELQYLVQAGHSINALNFDGDLLLNHVMDEKRVDIFDYLLSLDEIDVNLVNDWGETPLIHVAKNRFDEYFARRLIDKGANIHFEDCSGSTFLLHMAARYESDNDLSIGQLVVEKGADINQRNDSGKTPLYSACVAGNFDWVCMLLYHGGDATITTNDGLLPLVSVSQDMPTNQRLLLEEILFNYTFDDDKISVKLPILVEAMTNDSELFLKIFEKVLDVDYDCLDLQYMTDKLLYIKPKHLEIFVTKFSHIIQEIIDNDSLLDELIDAATYELHELQGIMIFFLKSDYVADFVQSSIPGKSAIAKLLRIFNREFGNPSIYKETFTKMISVMLTYGLTVTSNDLDKVYYYLGYCELFQILLHMDIAMADPDYDSIQSIAALYYNPLLAIDVFFDNVSVRSTLLDYFNDYKLKNAIIAENNLYGDNLYDDGTLERVKNLPQVPLLVELSRNAARKYILNHFNIKKSAQFYTILKWLPIGDINRSVISLEKKLY